MKISLIIFLSLAFLFVSYQSHAQKLEEQLFKKLCTEIYKQNEFYLMQKKLEGKVILVEDPVAGVQDIVYQSKDSFVLAFKKREKKEQFEILNSIEIPNLPLTDTVLILDSSGIFSPDLTAKNGEKVFIRKSGDLTITQASKIAIKKVAFRGDDFLISCSFPNSTMVGLYYFTLSKGIFNRNRLTYFYTDDPHFKH
jgi:hypothetical protein